MVPDKLHSTYERCQHLTTTYVGRYVGFTNTSITHWINSTEDDDHQDAALHAGAPMPLVRQGELIPQHLRAARIRRASLQEDIDLFRHHPSTFPLKSKKRTSRQLNNFHKNLKIAQTLISLNLNSAE
jgi:hypothetical protein